MKIVINTNYRAPGTKVCVDDLLPRLRRAGHMVRQNDWNNYSNYDLALFMSPDSEVKKAKRAKWDIVCGIMDPKIDTRDLREMVQGADFVVVSSLEQREALLPYNDQVFIYYMFPEMPERKQEHREKEGVRIGFHGNIEHLDSFDPNITEALDRLAEEMPVELAAIYNIERFGQWRMGVPKKTRVTHIQWQRETYYDELAKCDIGIINNVIYRPNVTWLFDWLVYHTRRLGLRINRPVNPNDYIVRYKYSANPGRLYVFAQLGVPVVADFAPSVNQFIRDGETGFIANTTAGWYTALKKLAVSPSLRQRMSDGLRNYINSNYSIEHNFTCLNKWMAEMVRQKKIKKTR